jgi:hypothetical protein
MTREEMRVKATARPWGRCGQNPDNNLYEVGGESTIVWAGEFHEVADAELAVLAVNAYESDQALIQTLVTALERARLQLVVKGYATDNMQYPVITAIDAALAVAKQREEKQP